MTTIDPKSVPIILSSKAQPRLTVEHVKAYARQKGSARLADVDALAVAMFGPIRKLGYNPDALASMSNLETDIWRSEIWKARLNPGGIGVTDGGDDNLGFANGTEAAFAMAVHIMAYARGYDNKLAQYIRLDPRFVEVHKAGWARTVGSLAGFGGDNRGRWATDPLYSEKAAGRLVDMLAAIKTPTPTPQPQPGGAPLPSGIIQKPTGNFFAGRHGRKPVAIVYHITDDMNVDNVISWFQNPNSNASAHVLIDRDGTMYQFLSSADAAWTNGDTNRPRTDLPVLNACLDAGGNLNDFTLTIEHVGTPEQPPTEAQYKSSIAISAYWRDRYGIRPSRGHMWRHADVNSVDRPYCPGPRFDLAKIITALGGDPADLAA